MKVAYIKEWHPHTGTCYIQRITVNQVEYDHINSKLKLEYQKTKAAVENTHIRTTEQMGILNFQLPLDDTEKIDNKYYLKLTQTTFIRRLFPDNARILMANTILMVK